MAVVKATIKSSLLALYNSAKSSKMTEDAFADTMADIIRSAILSSTVNITSVSGVTTGGGVSGPGTGTLS